MSGEEVIAMLAVTIGMLVITYPLVRAIAERIRPRGVEAGVKEELQLLREDLLSELQQTRQDIADLAERMDFAERLLARPNDTGRLP